MMKSRIKLTITSILLVTSLFILSGCNSSDTEHSQSDMDQPTTITFAATTGAVSQYEELITTFESQHPDPGDWNYLLSERSSRTGSNQLQ